MSTPFPEYLWSQLVDDVRAGAVVPVIGGDLATVEQDGRQMGLDEALATRLAAQLGVSDCPEPLSVASVSASFLDARGRPDDLYNLLRDLIGRLEESPVPAPLRQLAEIWPLKLFVSTTPDRLLEKALEEVRGTTPTTVAYAPDARENDLPIDHEHRAEVFVYHLLGVAGPDPFAATDEDVLEFLHQIQGPKRSPEVLLDVLEQRQLLLIGCQFPDWLTRFLIRIAKGEHRLTTPSGQSRFLAGGVVGPAEGLRRRANDHSLERFLEVFDLKTRVLGDRGAAEFVEELHRRFTEKYPEPEAPPPEVEAEDKIFLSYASEDREQVQQLQQALERAELAVWFDKRELEPGDQWNEKIKRNVRKCALFVPVLSKSVLTKDERYFRVEWDEAVQRQRMVAAGVPFILPVRIDDEVPEDHDLLPPRFRETQWSTLEEAPDQIAKAFRKKQTEAIS